MADIVKTIMAEIETDLTIKAMDICLDIESKGLFKKRKSLHIHGAVHSQDQMDRVVKIVKHHAGESFDVVDHLSIK